jgi:hypothetical protein
MQRNTGDEAMIQVTWSAAELICVMAGNPKKQFNPPLLMHLRRVRTMATAKNAAGRPAGSRDVREILGDLDADIVTAVLVLKPSAPELVEVREWIDADPIIRSQLRHGASGVVAQVCDLLDEAELDDTRRR